MTPFTVLVTGASGYVGRRLVPRLVDEGYVVRCFTRSPEKLQAEAWFDQVDVIEGDAHDYDSVRAATESMDVCYYLIHSFGAGEAYFAEYDRRAASIFGRAARERGVQRIIYLGMARQHDHQPDHVISRIETGVHLRRWNVPVTEFRTSVLLGAGSPALVAIQHLAERLPIIPAPTWMQVWAHPITTDDLLEYLVQALQVAESAGEIVQIGGPDVLSLGDMILQYATFMGLKRSLLPLPVAAPLLSAFAISALTPLSWHRARFLIEGLRHSSTLDTEKARQLFSIEPQSVEDMLQRTFRPSSIPQDSSTKESIQELSLSA